MDLTGNVAMVTGAGKRLGRAIALRLARAGCDLALHYRGSREEAEAAAEEIRSLGRRAETFQADLARPDQIEAMFAEIGAAFGRLGVLVNNAAVFHRTPLETLTADQWDTEQAVNARAPALCTRCALGLLRRHPGGAAVVNLTDSPAARGWAGYPAYCASKAALEAFTRSAARALAGEGVRVNAVAPGAILWSDQADEPYKEQVLRQIPMGRTGTPEDIAEAVVFLCEADYITGQILRVDGGWNVA